MASSFGYVAAVLAVSIVGCAMSTPADLTPDIDPNLPGLDAGYDPRPAPGQPDADAGASIEEQPDGSTQKPTSGMDAGVDATPPPPTAPKPTAGEVLITEVMFATSTPEPQSEWIELHNVATSDRSLAGLILKDGAARTHVIVGPLKIAGNGWVVLARNKAAAIAAKVPAGAIVYEYGAGLADNLGILLANGSTGGISLLSGATVITSAPYGGWFTAMGSSVQLKVIDPAQTGVKASWCLSPNAWSTGSERGSPGSACDCP